MIIGKVCGFETHYFHFFDFFLLQNIFSLYIVDYFCWSKQYFNRGVRTWPFFRLSRPDYTVPGVVAIGNFGKKTT